MIQEIELAGGSNLFANTDWSKVPLQKRKKLFLRAREKYYNSKSGTSFMSDATFDRLEDSIREDDPKWPPLHKTGTKVQVKQKKEKVKLDFLMPSLNKWKSTNVEQWLDRNAAPNVVVSKKMDGSSIQLIYEGGVPKACYTRGDGIVGKDISFLISHLKIPKKISYKGKLVLRCEGIFHEAVFQKYKSQFKSELRRAAASGMLNRSSDEDHTPTRELDIIVLLVLFPWTNPSKGLTYAKKLGFHVVDFKVLPTKNVDASVLTSMLIKAKEKTSHYDMDGLVVMWDKVNPKFTANRPDWAIAFKENVSEENAPVATVKEIFWDPSSHGKLIPIAIMEPIVIDGAKIQRATLKNAKWMKERGIGPGAKVKLIKGGDIIPDIVGVVKPGKLQWPDPSMGKWEWDANGTHIRLVNPSDNEEVVVKKILRFFKKMELDFIGEGTVRAFYEAGYDTIKKILAMEPKDIMKIEGFKQTSANKLYEQIQRVFVEGAFMSKLMVASGKFPEGLGSKRIAKIQKVYPDLLAFAEMSPKEVVEKISSIPTFQMTTAKMFADGIYEFKKWFDKSGIKIKKPEKVKLSSKKLQGVGVTFTGYRDSDQEHLIKANGGEIVSFGSSTDVLLYSLSGKPSSKIAKAQAKGIPVMTWEKFEKKYGL